MNAVSLAFPAVAPGTVEVGSVASMDAPIAFSEMLSALATRLPSQSVTAPENAAPADHAADERAKFAIVCAAPLSQLSFEIPPALDAGPAQSAAQLEAAQPTRRGEDDESATTDEASTHEEASSEPALWTIPQALAAVAAIAAAPPHPPVASQAPPDTQAQIAAPPPPPVEPGGGSLPRDGLEPIDSAPETAIDPIFASVIDAPLAAAGANERRVAPSVDTLSVPRETAPAGADPDLQQLDDLVREIAALSATTGRTAFRLTADQLGPLEVRLNSSDAGLAVTIRTHDDQGHHAVAQAQQQLSDDLRGNGVKVAATNVLMGGGADRHGQDRPQAPAPAPIDARSADDEQPAPLNESRPVGRYA